MRDVIFLIYMKSQQWLTIAVAILLYLSQRNTGNKVEVGLSSSFLQGRNLKCKEFVTWLWSRCLLDVKQPRSSTPDLYPRIKPKRVLREEARRCGMKKGSWDTREARKNFLKRKKPLSILHAQRHPKCGGMKERYRSEDTDTYTQLWRESGEKT